MAYKPLTGLYNENEKYLFLGNGINQLSKGFSWSDLLNNIRKSARITSEIGSKTYPLFFEELSFTLDTKKPVEANIRELKKLIADNAIKLTPNPAHFALLENNYYKHYLTTNYDYCIELAADPDCMPLTHNDRRTSKFSLYRYNEVNGHHIWHIHGECDNGRKSNPADSILIGFEHYADYLDKIHRLIKSDTGKGLAEQILEARYNWVHKFFTHDIDIVGFGMDFNELHLWFILNLRGRLIRKGAEIRNTIQWIIPEINAEKQMDKIELLKALGVKIMILKSASYPSFYEKFIGTLS
ncbi:hypothetical protein GS399_14130 [Pedobacter sp. HMF7647]|uniref:SIR2-like domain-containing protein n=1 Tax=Hufsiella arboris TaxID=2695275 RepID=A0A7K1YBY3_9SPHI|nr:SIR2 family protein [Hufsiella arboris]MXV52112.1 hypothetical protein [Hufsiella arboris]